jgi:hypothetical protein
MNIDHEVFAVAFYLVGHGPYREPRLVELQLMRINRYRDLVRSSVESGFCKPEIFVDLNFPRSSYPSKEDFPALQRLLEDIETKHIRLVYIDLQESTSFRPGEYAFVRFNLEKAGATVLNAFYDDEKILDRSITEKFGADANAWEIDDVSDLVCFFPALAAAITANLFRDELDGPLGVSNLNKERLLGNIHLIGTSNPYSSGRIPFIQESLQRKWWQLRRQREEVLKEERRKTEKLHRLGPTHAGVLVDDCGYPLEGARSDDELGWAEDRICRLFEFQKVEEGHFISYERVIREFRVFADIRGKGRIYFYVYGSADTGNKRQLGLSTRYFNIPDRLKNDLPEKWMREFNEQISR